MHAKTQNAATGQPAFPSLPEWVENHECWKNIVVFCFRSVGLFLVSYRSHWDLLRRCEGWGEGISAHTCEQLSQQPIDIPSSSLLPTLEAFSHPLAKPTVLDPSPRAGRQRSAYGTLQKSFFLPMKTPAKKKSGGGGMEKRAATPEKGGKKKKKTTYVWGMELIGNVARLCSAAGSQAPVPTRGCSILPACMHAVLLTGK